MVSILAALEITSTQWKVLLLVALIVLPLIYGFRDLLRFSFKRAWAISGVCFDESIRRKVLLITPLAILGVIIVAQLQRPVDEQDAIRQTIKFSVFATGLVVAITTIILACTNLPREIDNRVIYTVVTKPTTRLEIVLGKVMGFARVSATILLIMGIFSYGYLKLRAWNMRRDITQRLESQQVAPISVATLQYYRDAGLLNVKNLREPRQMQVYGKAPMETGSRRYLAQHGHGSMVIAFDVPPETAPAGDAQQALVVTAFIGYERPGAAAPTTAATQEVATTGPTTLPYYGPFIMSPEERAAIMAGTRYTTLPTISMDLVDEDDNTISAVTPVNDEKVFELPQRDTLLPLQGIIEDEKALQRVRGRVYLRISGGSADAIYFVDLEQTPVPAAAEFRTIVMGGDGQPQVQRVALRPAPNPRDPSKPAEPDFRSRRGTFGQQLRGGPDPSVAIFEFRNAKMQPQGEMAPFELRAGIERSGDEVAVDYDQPTLVSVQVHNRTSGELSEPIHVQPENSRTLFFRVPSKSLEGGDFDVLVRALTPGDFLGLMPNSLAAIADTQPFAWNLAKSMLILWLMSVLITAVAIFTSTFLSWPIAVVLTLVILLGHWGVQQLGDAIAPGIGAQVVTDFNLKNPAKAEAVRATVEKLSWFLTFVSTILPDISKFPAVEDVARGVAIAPATLASAAGVAFGFAIPLILLAYVLLRNKEVAP